MKSLNTFSELLIVLSAYLYVFNFTVKRFFNVCPTQNLSLLILSVLFFAISNTAYVPDVYAGNEFAEKYRAYQVEVRAGKASLDKKDYQSAVNHYSKAIEQSPFKASLYYNRGIALYKSGKEQEAIEDFDNVLVMDSRRYSAYVYRGLCREKTGKYLEALKDFTSALGMNPKDASVHNNLAWLYTTAKDEKVQDRAKALKHAKKAEELSKGKNAEILDTLARAYFINGMVKEAVEAEKKALKIESNNEGFKENLKVYEKGGEAVSSRR